jgi:hypothetical protein
MSTAAPEQAAPNAEPDKPPDKPPDEPDAKPRAKVAAKPDSKTRSAGDDRYGTPLDLYGNQLRTNHGVAITNFGSLRFGESDDGVPEVDGPVADKQLRDSRTVFCPPAEFTDAQRILAHRHLVLLSGSGTGRSLAGTNLLQKLGSTELLHLNAERPVETISLDTFAKGAGYLWNASQFSWEKRLTEGRLTRLGNRLRDEAGAWLVIVVDDIDQLASDARELAVPLTAPDPLKVLRKHLGRRGVEFAELPPDIRREVAHLLPAGVAPRKAVEIANLLDSMRQRGFEPDSGLVDLRKRTAEEVLAWFQERRPLASRALMIAVAVFENRSAAEIFDAALSLEKLLDNPRHMDQWPRRPPNLFLDTRAQRLSDIGAELVSTDHTRAQDPMIVRFRRPGWAASVRECVWWQYDRLRPTLKEWLGDRPTYGSAYVAGARVFGELLSRTPGPDPTAELVEWALSGEPSRREMAVAALSSMAEHAHLVPRVRERLFRWSRPDRPFPLRLTAALAYGGAIGQRYPNLALRQLELMTDQAGNELQKMVTLGIHELAKEPANRVKVLTELVGWTSSDEKKIRLRNMALLSSLFVLGLMGASGISPDRHRRNIATDDRSARLIAPLVDNLLANGQTARQVVSGLGDWANGAETDPGLVDGLHVVLREIFTRAGPTTKARISFDIRRLMFDEPEATVALGSAVLRTLEVIDDQDE